MSLADVLADTVEPKSVACPRCSAVPGELCLVTLEPCTLSSGAQGTFHTERWRAAGKVPVKPKLSTLPADALLAVAQLLTEQQPTRGDGWRGVPAEDHLDAAMRHLLKRQAGEPIDESGHPHLVHAAARLLMAVAVATNQPAP